LVDGLKNYIPEKDNICFDFLWRVTEISLTVTQDGIFKLLLSPGIDSKESIQRNRFRQPKWPGGPVLEFLNSLCGLRTE
jgi:hypothetical protein